MKNINKWSAALAVLIVGLGASVPGVAEQVPGLQLREPCGPYTSEAGGCAYYPFDPEGFSCPLSVWGWCEQVKDYCGIIYDVVGAACDVGFGAEDGCNPFAPPYDYMPFYCQFGSSD